MRKKVSPKGPASENVSNNYLIQNADFSDLNVYEKFSGPPALWERLKRYCKNAGVRPSHFVQEAILEKLNTEDYD
jgi:hypothetical protein